jgi:hypothetical protein
MAEVRARVSARSQDGYLIGQAAGIFNTGVLDLWTGWETRDFMTEVGRYVLPGSLRGWVINEHERDVIAKAFAQGHLLALNTHQMNGLLSDAPELAAHVARLARLRRETAAYVAEGTFRDNRGITVEGGEGYAYVSEAGLAVSLANPEKRVSSVRVTLSPETLGRQATSGGLYYDEDGTVQEVEPKVHNDGVVLEAKLPPYGAAVWCIPCVNEARCCRGL